MANSSQTSRRVVLCVLAGTLASITIYFVFMRTRPNNPNSRTNIARLQEEQAKHLAAWSQDRVIPVKSDAEWTKAIKEAKSEGCLIVPSGAKAVSESSIAPEIIANLNEASAGLIQAYIDDSPESLVKYMDKHDEIPNPEKNKVVEEILCGIRGVPKGSLKNLDPNELYVAFGKEGGNHPHWSAFVAGSMCKQFWRLQQSPNEELRQSIGADEGQVFQNIEGFAHFFVPRETINSVVKTNGAIMFCDVKVVVQFDEKLKGEFIPYYLRFWLDPQKNMWHPYQLNRIATGSNANSGESMHFF